MRAFGGSGGGGGSISCDGPTLVVGFDASLDVRVGAVVEDEVDADEEEEDCCGGGGGIIKLEADDDNVEEEVVWLR